MYINGTQEGPQKMWTTTKTQKKESKFAYILIKRLLHLVGIT